jgi:NAD(P)-dependent dehydrogenase (short-subunit alcohol dehydrogenase family)
MRGLRDTKVLVTGGTSEIGQGIAVSFAEEGTHVAINYRRHERDAAETGALSHQASVHSVHPVAVR